MSDLEMWGGVECTVARIGNRFRNQVVETGHHDRLDDLDRLAALGVRTVRYPFIWETVAPEHPEDCDWRWHDARVRRLDDLGIRIIAGLIHHGSGPRYTNLLDRAFPQLLAAHAAKVAARYPSIQLYTPVNEPLTTARLSGLYGHWYPHARDEGSFLRALVNQCHAVSLAMQTIRRIVPEAQLIQTEDIGKVFSTPRLRYQADFENARRWLSLDMLCGRIDHDHPLRLFLLDHGIAPGELDAFCHAPCIPNIIGVNHYLTSERYLHPHVHAFPAEFAASNGRQRYADLEAVRMPLPQGATGPQARLREVWDRYRLPMAVTEVHHGCTREEQLRWLMEVWHAAARLRANGVDVRAVTSWSLFGAVDWNSLLTSRSGCYEPGAFDARNHPPRLTAVGKAVRSLARHGDFNHPVIVASPGWWRRPERFYQRASRRIGHARMHARPSLVILGRDPQWLEACARATRIRGLKERIVDACDLPRTGARDLAAALQRLRPWAVVDTRRPRAGTTGIEDCAMLCLACDQLAIPLALTAEADMPEQRPYDPARSRDGALALLEQTPSQLNVDKTMLENTLMVHGGPEAIDAIIDLLIDGERGAWKPASRRDLVHEPMREPVQSHAGDAALWLPSRPT